MGLDLILTGDINNIDCVKGGLIKTKGENYDSLIYNLAKYMGARLIDKKEVLKLRQSYKEKTTSKFNEKNKNINLGVKQGVVEKFINARIPTNDNIKLGKVAAALGNMICEEFFGITWFVYPWARSPTPNKELSNFDGLGKDDRGRLWIYEAKGRSSRKNMKGEISKLSKHLNEEYVDKESNMFNDVYLLQKLSQFRSTYQKEISVDDIFIPWTRYNGGEITVFRMFGFFCAPGLEEEDGEVFEIKGSQYNAYRRNFRLEDVRSVVDSVFDRIKRGN